MGQLGNSSKYFPNAAEKSFNFAKNYFPDSPFKNRELGIQIASKLAELFISIELEIPAALAAKSREWNPLPTACAVGYILLLALWA